MRSSPKQIDLSPEQADSLIERVKSRRLDEKDYEILIGIIETVLVLYQALSQKSNSIQRLLKRIFGVKTESTKNVLKENPQPREKSAVRDEARRGHGRNGADCYRGAERVKVCHATIRHGDRCALCLKGKVYRMAMPALLVRLTGHAPVGGRIYELDRLRCNLCGAVFTADPPEGVGQNKYDAAAGSIISVLKYGAGVPFYRQEKLQESLCVPLPASTQWDIVESVANRIYPVYRQMLIEAAQGEIIHNDDTTMRVLSLMKEISREEKGSRRGIFTTGVLSILGKRKIALFFTGRKHAGENLDELLRLRASNLPIPVQMSDGLDRNIPKGNQTIECNCLTHGRRNFVDVVSSFPEECRHLVESLGKVYQNDALTKEMAMSPQERLEYHQSHSGPVMDELKSWAFDQIKAKKVEPNSGLGKAIEYMLKRWERLTRFLDIPNAPLDNNLCEQILKKAILHRKNSLFYRTEHGAFIGDMFMSLITTCSLCGANALEYLTILQEHSSQLFKDPAKWMPWNYRDNPNLHPS